MVTLAQFASSPVSSLPIYLSSHFTWALGHRNHRKNGTKSFQFLFISIQLKKTYPNKKNSLREIAFLWAEHSLLLLFPPLSSHRQPDIWISHVAYRCCHSFPFLHHSTYLLNKKRHFSAKLICIEENECKKMRKRSQDWGRENNMKEKGEVRKAKR